MMMAKSLLAVSLIAWSPMSAAQADRLVQSPLSPRMTGVFISPFAPVEAVTCEERFQSVCARPCTTWAGAQPDFQFSYDICVAKCPRAIRGTCR